MILERLIRLRDQFSENDGSQELIDGYIEAIADEGGVEGLLANPAFKKMLESMRRDFRSRMLKLVSKDPELKEIKNVFIRTIGKKGAEAQIETMIVDFLDEPDAVNEPPVAAL